jgi:sodium/potassium/calcium exchanger 6
MALADELVDCLKLIGIVLGLSPGVLGVSVLAVGNSMPDFFADIGVAKEGHPRMAAAGELMPFALCSAVVY